MKVFQYITIALALSVGAGCATNQQSNQAAYRAGPNYSAVGAVSGVSAYVYGDRTLLHYQSPPASLSIEDEFGFAVPFEKEGNYYRMARKLDHFTARADVLRVTTFTFLTGTAGQGPVNAATATADRARIRQAETLRAAEAENMRARIASLEAKLAQQAKAAPAAPVKPMAAIAQPAPANKPLAASAISTKPLVAAKPAVTTQPAKAVVTPAVTKPNSKIVTTNKTQAKAVAIKPTESWKAPVGSTLRIAVEQWSKQAGWNVDWKCEELDYEIKAPLNFNGTYEEAIAWVFDLYTNAPRRFDWNGHQPQKLLIVNEYHNKGIRK